jgi:multiple sugar transport system substrate-binding protein
MAKDLKKTQRRVSTMSSRDNVLRCVLSSFLLLSLLLSACGPATSTPQAEKPKAKEIVIAGIAGGTYLDPLNAVAKKFTEKTGVKITINGYPYESLYEKITLATKAKSPDIDMFFFDEPWLPYLASGKHVVALDADYGYKTSDKLFQVSQDFGYWPPPYGAVPVSEKNKQQHIYAIPGIANTNLMYVRGDILKEKGLNPPKTWEDVLNTSKAVYDPQKPFYGFEMRGSKGDPITYSYMAMLWSMGGDMFDENWNPIVNNEASIKAAELTQEIMKYSPPGWGEYGDAEQGSDAISGRAMMGLMWPHGSFMAEMEDPAKCSFAGKWIYLPIPSGDGGSVSTLGHWLMAISAYSDAKDESYDFLKFFLEDDTALEYAKAGGYPANISVYEKEPLKSVPWIPVFLEIMKNPKMSRWTPRTTEWNQIVISYGTWLNQVLTGSIPIKEGLDNSAKDLKQILTKAKYY